MQLVAEAVAYAPFPSRRPLSWTRLAGVVRRHGQQHAAVPCNLIAKVTAKLAPSLIEDGTVQSRLLADLLSRLFNVAFGVPGDVTYLQVLNVDEPVVLAVDILPA